MKVLHIINNLGSGGAEKLIEEILPIMNNIEGIRADILLLTDKNNVFDKKLKENKININVVPIRKIYSPLNILYLKEIIVKGNYDIVHAHLFPTQYWVAVASKLIFKEKPKFITTEHSTFNRRRKKFYFKYIDKCIYSCYDKIISISEKTQENLISWLGVGPEKLGKFQVIENGININKFKEAIPYKKTEISSKFKEDTKLVCMVGRFTEQKDQETLIRSMQKLSDDVHLLLIGEGPLKEQYVDIANSLGIADRIHFLGFRNDIDRLLKTVDLVILSSRWEGFGLAAVEGMACGKLVVGTNVDGLREVIGDDELLFEVGNVDELANKINYLLNNDDIYTNKVKKLIKRSEIFNIDRMIRRYIKIYNHLIYSN